MTIHDLTNRVCDKYPLFHEEPDWQKTCERYPLSDITGEGDNVSETASGMMRGLRFGILIELAMIGLGTLIVWIARVLL